jgi:leader peptidase (prepilin peptidase)/N-methyltransferase
LNVLAYRLVFEKDIVWTRSACPSCNTQLAWYDLIPVFSWLFLRGMCRSCKKPISLFYPCIELLTVFVLSALYFAMPSQFFFAYFIFFSALIVTIRSDLETMLISRFMTCYLIPVGLGCSAVGLLPIDLIDSVGGALLGYGFLWAVSRVFFWITQKQGIGQGDLELLAFIGSFTGVSGCWMSLTIGSIFGSLVGLSYVAIARTGFSVKIPFGPFLASGAIVYVLFQEIIEQMLLLQL